MLLLCLSLTSASSGIPYYFSILQENLFSSPTTTCHLEYTALHLQTRSPILKIFPKQLTLISIPTIQFGEIVRGWATRRILAAWLRSGAARETLQWRK
ncbi:hypothetical protein HD806DRAFT_221265 [Xylariaceae sp. AK1471]|nr:hypothetical protein HD806DRAFT_221265 [Xylariaceae sp. AK1471]